MLTAQPLPLRLAVRRFNRATDGRHVTAIIRTWPPAEARACRLCPLHECRLRDVRGTMTCTVVADGRLPDPVPPLYSTRGLGYDQAELIDAGPRVKPPRADKRKRRKRRPAPPPTLPIFDPGPAPAPAVPPPARPAAAAADAPSAPVPVALAPCARESARRPGVAQPLPSRTHVRSLNRGADGEEERVYLVTRDWTRAAMSCCTLCPAGECTARSFLDRNDRRAGSNWRCLVISETPVAEADAPLFAIVGDGRAVAFNRAAEVIAERDSWRARHARARAARLAGGPTA
jgi:hypothetical protein